MNTPKDDNCKDMKELLSAYRDAELDAAERSQVEVHLGSCEACREELAAVESVVMSLKKLPPLKLERDFADDIESIIKRAESQEEPAAEKDNVVKFERKSKKGLWIAAAAAVSVFLMVAGYIGTNGGSTPTIAVKPDSKVVSPVESTSQPAVEVATQTIPDNEVVGPDVAPVENKPADVVPANVVATEKPKVSPPQVIASTPKQEAVPIAPVRTTKASPVYLDDLSDNEALVALSDMDEDYDDFYGGISTDEDGLYAIKM